MMKNNELLTLLALAEALILAINFSYQTNIFQQLLFIIELDLSFPQLLLDFGDTEDSA